MTTASASPRWLAGTLLPPLDPLGEQLGALACDLGMTALFESTDGALVAHAVIEPPSAPVVAAIVDRDARPLDNAMREKRSAGLLAGSVVHTGTVAGQDVCIMSVRLGERPLGRLWLFGLPGLQDRRLAAHLADLTAVLAAVRQLVTGLDLQAVLDGEHVLPQLFEGLSLWVLACDAPGLAPAVVAERLRCSAALRPLPGSVLRATWTTERALALLGTPASLPSGAVSSAINRWCDGESAQAFRVGLADIAHGDLPQARKRAELALTACRPGCVELPDVRSDVLLRRIGSVLGNSGDLGPDPVGHLVADHEDMARGLLNWLEAHGTIGAAARRLQCHPNTLRYRVRRATELLGGSLDDPALRLEVHLRLRHALGGLADPDL